MKKHFTALALTSSLLVTATPAMAFANDEVNVEAATISSLREQLKKAQEELAKAQSNFKKEKEDLDLAKEVLDQAISKYEAAVLERENAQSQFDAANAMFNELYAGVSIPKAVYDLAKGFEAATGTQKVNIINTAATEEQRLWDLAGKETDLDKRNLYFSQHHFYLELLQFENPATPDSLEDCKEYVNMLIWSYESKDESTLEAAKKQVSDALSKKDSAQNTYNSVLETFNAAQAALEAARDEVSRLEDEISKQNGQTSKPSATNKVVMHRVYNPNSGEHFYTANTAEKKRLVSVGWQDEGVGWTAPKTSSAPVYRLYNQNAGDHHYTMSQNERDHLISLGWKDEGIGWYSDHKKSVPLYRQYNPNAQAGSHNYTTVIGEHHSLINAGWNDEGIAWYGVK